MTQTLVPKTAQERSKRLNELLKIAKERRFKEMGVDKAMKLVAENFPLLSKRTKREYAEVVTELFNNQQPMQD
jgi:hypothetical protein